MCLESRYYRDDAAHSNSRIAIYYHTEVLGRSTVDSTKTPPRISVQKDSMNIHAETQPMTGQTYQTRFIW